MLFKNDLHACCRECRRQCIIEYLHNVSCLVRQCVGMWYMHSDDHYAIRIAYTQLWQKDIIMEENCTKTVNMLA